jgi:hypothetical protein
MESLWTTSDEMVKSALSCKCLTTAELVVYCPSTSLQQPHILQHYQNTINAGGGGGELGK